MTTWTTVIDGVPVESTTTAQTPTTWSLLNSTDTESSLQNIIDKSFAYQTVDGAVTSLNRAGTESDSTRGINQTVYAYGDITGLLYGLSAINSIFITADQQQASHGEQIAGFQVVHAVGGGGASGSRSAIHSRAAVTGAISSEPNNDVVSMLNTGYSISNQGGDGTFTTIIDDGYVGSLWGNNSNVWLANGATYYRGVYGTEINCSIMTGGSSYAKGGILIAKPAIDTVRAVNDDAAIMCSRASGATTWKYGIQFGLSWGLFPFDTDSVLIGAKNREYPTAGTMSAGYGVDFRDVTFTNYAFTSNKFSVDTNGKIITGTATNDGTKNLIFANPISGGTSAWNVFSTTVVQSDVTTAAYNFGSSVGTVDEVCTISNIRHFQASQGTFGASSTVTNQVGFYANSSITGAVNNYGFYGDIASSSGKWNFYAGNTAANYFRGITTFGTTFGYGTASGVGGAVTQETSRTTGVELNKACGAITLYSEAGSTTWQTFTVTNSLVSATDTLIFNQKSGTDLYEIHVTNVATGSFKITFRTTGGTTTEQPVFNFALIKSVAS